MSRGRSDVSRAGICGQQERLRSNTSRRTPGPMQGADCIPLSTLAAELTALPLSPHLTKSQRADSLPPLSQQVKTNVKYGLPLLSTFILLSCSYDKNYL